MLSSMGDNNEINILKIKIMKKSKIKPNTFRNFASSWSKSLIPADQLNSLKGGNIIEDFGSF